MKLFTHVVISGCCAIAAGCAGPQPNVSREFPPDATPIGAQALKDRLSGRSFTVRLAGGGAADLNYGADGRYSIRLSSGESDQGSWRTEESRVCVTYKGHFPSGCAQVHATADRLYSKRANTGEVLLMIPRP
jgi:hypothetical protein